MIRSALLLCAGIIFAACFACTPAQSPQTPVSPPSVHRLTNCDVNDPSKFPSAVTMLSSGFVPGNLKAPTPPIQPLTLTPQMQSDLIAAFKAAPPLFRSILCRLDGIYIDPSATSSWGFRVPASSSDSNSLNRYIGLAANLWGNAGNSSPSTYSAYETGVLSELTGWPGGSDTVPDPPAFDSGVWSGTTDVDTSALTLVAVLAHEFGHVLWYDKVKGSSYPYYPNKFCQVSSTNFFDGSWSGTVGMPDTWVGFAKQSDTPVPGTGSLAAVQAAVQNSQWSTAGSNLNLIYTTVWPSLLGSASPEEDFAETVKLLVLTLPGTNGGHPVTSMPLSIYTVPELENPTYAPDLFAGLSRAVLANKIRCINSNSS